MGLFDLFRRHFLDHLLLRNRGVGVTADRRKHIPHIGSHQVRRRHTPANLVIPADAGLGARMPFHRRPQIPLERTDIVAFDTQTHCVHNADEFLGVGVAGSGGGSKSLHRFGKAAFLHQVARLFDFGGCGTRDPGQNQKHGGNLGAHFKFLFAAFLILVPTGQLQAGAIPEPLSDADFLLFDEKKAALGQLLFYDPVLSGNRNISCGTCHNHDFGAGDGLSLGIGEGGVGLGPDRTAGVGSDRIAKRIPRNSPGLWNLGAQEITVLFHDGRLSISDEYGNGFNSPAEEWLPSGLDNILAAQALFPLTSQFEMAGNPKENQIAGAAHDRIDAVWPIVAKRVRIIPEYGRLFVEAFEDLREPSDVTIAHVANAIGAFVNSEWRSFDSPFDAWLAGDMAALNPSQTRGLELFFGRARCSVCHSGKLFADHEFHALALPHFGPGRTRRFDPFVRDVGLMGESDRLEDAYRFRTPSLRNVALTAPYGHNGAYRTLESIVRHHLDPVGGFDRWTSAMVSLPHAPWLESIDFVAFSDGRERARLRAKSDITPIELSDRDIADLIAFLKALTGTKSTSGRLGKPPRVPSGLPID